MTPNPPAPPIPPTAPAPPPSRFPTRIHRLQIAGRTIDLLAPIDPDALLDDSIILQRYQPHDYLPYWPIVWPSGLMMADRILTAQTTPPTPPAAPAPPSPGPRAIELGCGLGLAGIAAALRGWHITFTDFDPEAVEFAAHNALRNGVPPHLIASLQMDWRACIPQKFPWIIASDVLYERRLQPLVLDAINSLLSPAGVAWVSDPQRSCAEDFPILAVDRGFRIATLPMQGRNFHDAPQPANLYLLSRAQSP